MTDSQAPERELHARAVASRAHRTPYVPTPVPASRMARFVLPNAGAIVALVLLPVALVAHVHLVAWLLAVGAWLLNRVAHEVTMRFVAGLPQTMAVGAAGLGMMLRVWIVAAVLFFVGADFNLGHGSHVGANRPDLALPAMLLFMAILAVDVGFRSLVELRRYRAGAIAEPTSQEPV